MNICIVNDDIFPSFGGRGRIAEKLGANFASRGHKVTFMCSTIKEDIVIPNVQFIQFPYFNLPKTNKKFRFALPFKNISRVLKENKIDVVHINGQYLLGFVVYLCAKRLKIPVVQHFHIFPEHFTANTKIFVPIKSIIGKYLSWLGNKADYSVFPTEFSKQNYQKYGFKGNFSVIGTGVDLTLFNLNNSGEFKKKFDLKEKFVLFVGRLSKEKNVSGLIDSFEIICKEVNCKLVIIGEGYLMNELKQKAENKGLSDKIIFTGRLESSIVSNAYSDASVFVLPSFVDVEPLVLSEAQACGCPVISSKCDTFSAKGQLDEGNSGFLINPSNTQEIAEKVILLLKNDMLNQKMRICARKFAETKDVNKIIESFEKLYFSLKNSQL